MSDQWLKWAERVDAWRLIPRVLVITFLLFTIYVVGDMLDWYKSLPAIEREIEASGFALGVITAVTGLLTATIKIYQSTGRKWKGQEGQEGE